MEQELQSWRERVDEQAKEITHLKEKYAALMRKASEQGQRNKELERRLASTEAQYHQGHNQRERVLVKVKAQVSNLKSRGEDDRRAIGKLVKENATLKAQLARIKKWNADSLQKALDSPLAKENKKLEKQLANMEGYKRTRDAYFIKWQKAEQQLADAQDSKARLRKWNETCHDNYEKLEQQLAKYKGKLYDAQWACSEALAKLSKFGGHTADCRSHPSSCAVVKECTCGYAAIAKEMG